MNVLNQLASALQRKDEGPNIALAEELVKLRNKKAIAALVLGLHKRNKDIQSDCIKVLYEIGERAPALIEPHKKEFLDLLESKNNRLVWGAMTALDCITTVNPLGIYRNIPRIAQAADKGSVIAKDHYTRILAKLAKNKKFKPDAQALLLNQLLTCAANQLPMYAEICLPVVDKQHAPQFIAVLEPRLHEPATNNGLKRIEKVIQHLQAKMQKRQVVKKEAVKGNTKK